MPTDGTRVLISDQGPSNVSCRLYQDVAIPSGSPASLTVAEGAVFIINGYNNSTASLDVTTPEGTLIANLHSRTSAQGNDALIDRPSVNLDAYAGHTVPIISTVNVPNEDCTGLLLDNVRLSANGTAPPPTAAVATMTEWGMIIFALLAVMGSVYYLRRHIRFGS